MRIFHILLYLSSQMRMAEWQCHLWHLLRHAGRARHFGPLKCRIARRRSPCALPGNRLWRWWTISSPKVSQFLWWRVGGPGWSPRGSNWQAQAVFDWVRIEWNDQNYLVWGILVLFSTVKQAFFGDRNLSFFRKLLKFIPSFSFLEFFLDGHEFCGSK